MYPKNQLGLPCREIRFKSWLGQSIFMSISYIILNGNITSQNWINFHHQISYTRNTDSPRTYHLGTNCPNSLAHSVWILRLKTRHNMVEYALSTSCNAYKCWNTCDIVSMNWNSRVAAWVWSQVLCMRVFGLMIWPWEFRWTWAI